MVNLECHEPSDGYNNGCCSRKLVKCHSLCDAEDRMQCATDRSCDIGQKFVSLIRVTAVCASMEPVYCGCTRFPQRKGVDYRLNLARRQDARVVERRYVTQEVVTQPCREDVRMLSDKMYTSRLHLPVADHATTNDNTSRNVTDVYLYSNELSQTGAGSK